MLFYALMLSAFALMIFTIGCAFAPAFHNTALTDLNQLSKTLTNTRLDDLFRRYPTLRLVNSTEIGDGNIRHEFSYITVEKEDGSKRPFYVNVPNLYEKRITFSINIFVNASGVVYEVLKPVATDGEIVQTKEEYKRYEQRSTKPKSPRHSK